METILNKFGFRIGIKFSLDLAVLGVIGNIAWDCLDGIAIKYKHGMLQCVDKSLNVT